MKNQSSWCVVGLVVTVVLVSLALFSDAGAHLALIRQGPESADTPEDGDRFGQAVASGDFDGDGYDDLATGAPREDVNSGNKIGTVIINRGSPFGLTHENAYEREHSFLADDSLFYGFSLAAGDFDNDGFDDLAVGTPYHDFGAKNAGRVYVYYGSNTGLENFAHIFDEDDFLGESNGTEEWFGWSLTTGDFNEDLYDDLAIGATGEDNEAGAVFVLYGSNPAGLTTTGAQSFRQSDLGETDIPMDHFGHALAAGNVTLEQQHDLVVGTPDHGSFNGGRVYIFPGSASGATSATAYFFDPPSLGIPVSPNLDSHFGWSLAIGHFMTETGGFDIAVGEPNYPTDGVFESGRVVVVNVHIATQAQVSSSDSDSRAARLATSLIIQQDDAVNATVDYQDRFGWSLAAGDFDGIFREDLAVGAPFEQVNFDPNSGTVHIFMTKSFGAGGLWGITRTFTPDALFDRERGQLMGYSLAFGNFDGHPDSTNLAIGMPDADFDYWVDDKPREFQAGAVAILAPHRQIRFTRARSAALFGCDGELLFSVRPFDPVQIASTCKIFPVWAAADHIKWGLVDSLDTIVVDRWIADCYNGSSAGLTEDEEVTLIDLMKMSISVSGGDACYAIADMLTGQTWTFETGDCDAPNDLTSQVPAFVDTINARAAAVGGLDTQLNNPGGRPYKLNGVEPHSTAYDMGLVGRAAMQNEIFRDIVDTSQWLIPRNMFINGSPVATTDTLTYGFISRMRNRLGSVASGLKPGNNNESLITRVASAVVDTTLNKHVVASIFGVQLTDSDDVSGGWADNKVAEMCSLGVVLCGSPAPIPAVPIPPDPSEPRMNIPSISTETGNARGAIIDLHKAGEGLLVELYRRVVATPETCVNLWVDRTLDWIVGPGETVSLTATPFDSLCGLRLHNIGNGPASLMVQYDVPFPTSLPITFAGPGDTLIVPPTGGGAPSFTLSITNNSLTEPESLQVDELGWKYEVNLGDGTFIPNTFSGMLNATGSVTYGNIAARVFGKDIGAGNTVTLVIRDPGTATAVDDGGGGEPFLSGLPLVVDVRNYPNPFNPEATIEYRLSNASPVSIRIYDVAGRLVRLLDEHESKPAGYHTLAWDGTDNHGSQVASGVYFVQLRAGATTRSARMVLLK